MSYLAKSPVAFFPLVGRCFTGFVQIFQQILALVLIWSILHLITIGVLNLNIYVGYAVAILYLVASIFIYSVVLHRSYVVLSGEKLRLSESIRWGQQRFLTACGVIAVLIIFWILLGLVNFALWKLGDLLHVAWLFLIISILIDVFAWVLLFFTFPFAILDNKQVFAAFDASIRLVWRQWWRTFGVLLISMIIVYVLSLIGVMLGGFSNPWVGGQHHVVWVVVYTIINDLIVFPLLVSFTIVLFNDLKLRKGAANPKKTSIKKKKGR